MLKIRFNIRMANESYSSDDFESYQKHFTVMNFIEEDDLFSDVRGSGSRTDPSVEEFKHIFNSQMKDCEWNLAVQPKIDAVLRDIFIMVRGILHTDQKHPSGQILHPNAGWSLNQANGCPAIAMYGVDVILRYAEEGDHTIQPTVLEVNFMFHVQYMVVVLHFKHENLKNIYVSN